MEVNWGVGGGVVAGDDKHKLWLIYCTSGFLKNEKLLTQGKTLPSRCSWCLYITAPNLCPEDQSITGDRNSPWQPWWVTLLFMPGYTARSVSSVAFDLSRRLRASLPTTLRSIQGPFCVCRMRVRTWWNVELWKIEYLRISGENLQRSAV